MRQLSLAIIALLATTGCAQQSSNTDDSSLQTPLAHSSVLGSLRPKADPAVVKQIEEEEAAAEQKAQVMEKQAEAQVQSSESDPSKRNLPDVSFAPMAPPAEQIVQQSKNNAGGGLPFWPFNQQQNESSPPPASRNPAVASYGGGYGGSVPPPPPETASSSGLVPPPPAVSLSTQAQAMPYGLNPQDPYGSTYGSPYGQPPPAASQPTQQHAPGSLFSSGSRQALDNSDETSAPVKKRADFTPITPSGMQPRSAAKQKDDLKTLLKGAIASSSLADQAAHDRKVAASLAKLDVGQPAESSKGVFNVSQRQLDTLYKGNDPDKHIAQPVKKIQTDVAQAYYRYLYAYNKFALAQQTIAARKQEADMADSDSEQQRATTDLAQAQNDADQARDDMRSAQTELASVAGATAARAVITHVSGVAPNMEALNAAENAVKSSTAQAPAKGGFFLSSLFGGGKTDKANKQESALSSKAAKNKKLAASNGDLAPSPDKLSAPLVQNQAAAHKSPETIAFQLKNVHITPRKSVLKVALRNNTSATFSFDPDVISISEGTRKLSDATVRADFDTTLVQPNQEITGTITIFGHPWSDRLSVAVTDGTRTVQLKH